ncbi:MAG: DUF1801 domain-containing protein [Actinomycetaceae bacterium]|nr:DUF1801 domain-containing protein [Actinomycetaceae bacterium]MDY6083441.1 DUF1801 domain-containing protein [Actinomycetaceae bacterium]
MAVQIAQPGEDVPEFFGEWLQRVDDEDHREIFLHVLMWVHQSFPELGYRIAWNQPMFTLDKTFIIGFSPARNHLSFAPERDAVLHFSREFTRRGISFGKMLVRMPWKDPVPYDMLTEVITYNMEQKRGMTSFWRQ